MWLFGDLLLSAVESIPNDTGKYSKMVEEKAVKIVDNTNMFEAEAKIRKQSKCNDD